MPRTPAARTVSWRRIHEARVIVALVLLLVSAVGLSLGTVVAGRLTAGPTAALVWLLAVLVVGAAVLSVVGSMLWAAVCDRTEGELRSDLLEAALHQPLSRLSEQAVGEILDRVDDDTHEVGTLMRVQVWQVLQGLFGAVPMWVIAGLTWWPAWLLFPLTAVLIWVALRRLLPRISESKVVEEEAWSDHAAALEEAIAARDDLRTSLGQSFVQARLATLTAQVHHLFHNVLRLERLVILRAGLLLAALFAVVVGVGVALVLRGGLSIPQLVTIFLVSSMFVGQIDQIATQLPDLQAGFGAVLRLRQMLALAPEPTGGAQVPPGPVDLRFADLDFAYPSGGFALHGIDLHLPAGATVALVGRTGSGKSTLASLVSRAVDPEPGSVFLGGTDVLELDLQELRSAVGVVTQRTEILAGTLAENIALFADLDRSRIEAAVQELGLGDWVAALPHGLDTLLGPGGTSLSAGEEQLVAFARLLVREVRVVVLDEATARMDPVTESRVVAAADRLLAARTGILIAHRLSTTARADIVVVLERGQVVQQGPRAELARIPGPFADLLAASEEPPVGSVPPDGLDGAGQLHGVGGARRVTTPPGQPELDTGLGLARGVWRALRVRPRWGLAGIACFFGFAVLGPVGVVTGWLWGLIVQDLRDGSISHWLVIGGLLSVAMAPLLMAQGLAVYARWWIEVMLRVRLSVLRGQTSQHRLAPTPPGEVVARALDADRFARYADRWADFLSGLLVAVVTAVVARSLLAGGVVLVVMAAAVLTSLLGRPVAGRTAVAASQTRARFGRALVSALESARTVKLAGRTPQVHAHVQRVDSGRVQAAVREHRMGTLLEGVPLVMLQLGVVAAWAAFTAGRWQLPTTLLVVNALNGFGWFARVSANVVLEAPGTRAWQQVTAGYAGGADLVAVPPGVDLVAGTAPPPQSESRTPLQELRLRDLGVVHEDGTIGLGQVDLDLRRGELVLVLGPVGSGKSSLLRALAGLVDHTGSMTWNGAALGDAQTFLRPGQVAYVAQVPRVLSGTFAENVQLGFASRGFEQPVADARLAADVAAAGGPDALIGHRGVRLSGGQVQRLALARALATRAELVLADDVSSALDAATEIELWTALRARGSTVLGATSKRAALRQADRVVVLEAGRVAAVGPWRELEPAFGHLAG